MGDGRWWSSRKFLPSYNMALNLLRVYTPEEAEALMQRSFGQFQKRLAADADGRATGQRPRAAGRRPQASGTTRDVSIDDVGAVLQARGPPPRDPDRAEAPAPRGGRGAARRGAGRQTRAMPWAEPARTRAASRGRGERAARAAAQAQGGALARVSASCSRSTPRSARCRKSWTAVSARSRARWTNTRASSGRLRGSSTETGFLAQDKPTDKGLFASRIYGENTILVAEAVWLGWFEGLTPEELCAVLVMLAAEDRERGRRDRQAARAAPLPDARDRADGAAGPLAVLPLRRHGERPRRAEPPAALPRLHRLRLPLVDRRAAGPDPAAPQRRHRRRDQGDEGPVLAAAPARVGACGRRNRPCTMPSRKPSPRWSGT